MLHDHLGLSQRSDWGTVVDFVQGFFNGGGRYEKEFPRVEFGMDVGFDIMFERFWYLLPGLTSSQYA